MTYDAMNHSMEKILLAEDEASIAEVCKMVLESRGFKVVVASNGQECIEYFLNESSNTRGNGESPFDVVILDYRLPIKSGFEVAKEILSKFPNQRIIIASASPADSLLKLFRTLCRFVEFLQKPFDLDQLVSLVEHGDQSQGKRTSVGVGLI